MGAPVKRQLVVVPLILSLILGSSCAHAWRRALLSDTKASQSDDAPRGPGKKRGRKGGAIGAALNAASGKKGNAIVIPGFNLKGRKRGGRGGKGKSKGNKQRDGSGGTNGVNPGEDGRADGGIEGEESGDNIAGDDNGGENGGDNNSDDSSNGCPDGGDAGGNDNDGGNVSGDGDFSNDDGDFGDGNDDFGDGNDDFGDGNDDFGDGNGDFGDGNDDFAEWASELVSLGCPLEHGGAEGLGQNLYWLSPAALTPEEDRGAVQSWVEEKADWTPSPIPDGCADGKMCGHYTQVVWRDTTHVGCASAQCPDGSGMWVCDYSPPGNFDGETPF
ncbi:unnamed protein product [Closterium sp. NIES-64]|nr:unnamed protein product [Closterium sp. NIES-64]